MELYGDNRYLRHHLKHTLALSVHPILPVDTATVSLITRNHIYLHLLYRLLPVHLNSSFVYTLQWR